MYQSVVFVQPGELQASAILQGDWAQPPAELVAEFWQAGLAGNDPYDACSAFIEWCVTRTPRAVRGLGVFSLPGLPWANEDYDRWDWYDRLMAQLAAEKPPAVLLDVDTSTVTVGGEVLWPPPELRRQVPDRRAHPPGALFPVGWHGPYFGKLRPGWCMLPPEDLPPIRVALFGTFDWLRAQPIREENVTGAEEVAANLDRLLATTTTGLPTVFVEFYRSPDLWARLAPNVSFHRQLDSAAAEIRGGLGWLVRFKSDCQGCMHWNLYLSPDGAQHSVVTTYFYSGAEYASRPGGRPHPRDITTCANSFEEFVYRLWLETEISVALSRGGPMPPGGEEYLDFYRSRATGG
jgi:hypothetical protein